MNLSTIKQLTWPALMLLSVGLASLMTLLSTPSFRQIVDFSDPTGLEEIAIGSVQQPQFGEADSPKASEEKKKPSQGTTIYLGVITDPKTGKVIQRAYVSTPPYGTTKCDQTAAKQAHDEWQADTANEKAYHDTQIALINQIPDGSQRTEAMNAENERHLQRQSEIDTTYAQRLKAANC